MMSINQLSRLAVISTLLLLLFGCATLTSPNPDPEFAAFLERVDDAQLELQQGKPDRYKALWSHGPDVTLAGGFGGTIEQGWERVAQRLDWASAQFVQGRNDIHRLAYASSGVVGYLIQTEHLVFKTPGQSETTDRAYRVTMLFRREQGGWRIIHRHADTQIVKQQPK